MNTHTMTSRTKRFVWRLAVLACMLPMLAACDEGELLPPDTNDDIFNRYVALGNSITAGFQSFGINQTTQEDSYAVLLADRMGTRFEIPALTNPGCPPPVTNVLTGARVGGPNAPACAFRQPPSPTVLNNVAVPGAKVIDATQNLSDRSSANTLTSFILGGRTQVQAAADAEPTFASIWLGNNDALGAALQGTPQGLTPLDQFQSDYDAMISELTDAGVERGVLVGVANVAFIQQLSPTQSFPLSIPNLSAGQVYFGAEGQINAQGAAASPAWGSFTVANSCAPGTPGGNALIPFEYGVGALFALASQGQDVTLDCADNRTLEEIYGPQTVAALDVSGSVSILTPDEINQIAARVQAFNQYIASVADENGWAYVDPSPVLGSLFAAGLGTPQDASDDLVPKFPRLDPAAEQANTFGDFFSEDGVHPSSLLHRVVANEVIDAVNAEYGTSLQPVEDAPTIPSPEG